MYNNLNIQSVLKVNGITGKWIFMQHIFILYDHLSENFVRYSLHTLKKSLNKNSGMKQ